MIILDTNVISEFLEPVPDTRVVGWLDAQDGDEVYLTAVTAGELRTGIAIMPAGNRRAGLHNDVEGYLEETFVDHILSFDNACTPAYAAVHRERRRLGRPIANLDAQIAAICLQYSAILATRNVKDFIETGVETVNPWTD